ncbi:MAG: flavin reductase family protein [Syntrophomonadaceae bacterium]|nr:flavin reductase family protein [Syntrophomonadaceae bacterium]
MRENISWQDSRAFLEQLPRGAFLTVSHGGRLNTMTIGWGSIGHIWQRPVIMVMVRYSRHTHQLIKDAPDFTVSLPLDGNLKKELGQAGTKSGRDMDKFAELSLAPQPALKTVSPVIKGGGLHYECRVIYKQEMDENALDAEIRDQYYSDGDYHVLYYGEIVACYRD